MNIPAAIRRNGQAFLLALGFLTRLAPARRADESLLRESVALYPLAGALLGLLLVLPFALGFFAGRPAVQAWFYVLLSAWCTRALHLDALADLLDALGSGKEGEAFFAVLKDSRLGAFGAAGLVLYLMGQAALAHELFARGDLAALFFAPVFGRCLPLPLSKSAPPHPKASLGRIFAGIRLSPRFLAAPLAVLVTGLWLPGAKVLLPAILIAGAALAFLAKTARKQGGYNGDFLGCAIVAGEMALLAAAALA